MKKVAQASSLQSVTSTSWKHVPLGIHRPGNFRKAAGEAGRGKRICRDAAGAGGYRRDVKLHVPDHPFDGYIFDCDGTIADTMPAHYRAWCRAMAEAGGEFPEKLFYEWGGRPTPDIARELQVQYGLAMDPLEIVRRKEGYYLEEVHAVQPILPVLEIAKRMHGVKPLAIASGGHHELVDATLNALGIFAMFDAVVCAEDYVRGKPFPDPFLEAARRIGVAPEDCLVFEDSPTGVEAAKAAGMQYVYVPSAGRVR